MNFDLIAWLQTLVITAGVCAAVWYSGGDLLAVAVALAVVALYQAISVRRKVVNAG